MPLRPPFQCDVDEAHPGERHDEAQILYKRSCKLGLSLGCVNYGAGLVVNNRKAKAAEPTECARRIFALACDVGDSMGCGMVGRLMVQAGTTQSRSQARNYFEEKCSLMKGPPCRMLAYYLERGDFGAYEPAHLRFLMTRACEGQDAGACVEWKRVDDTFN